MGLKATTTTQREMWVLEEEFQEKWRIGRGRVKWRAVRGQHGTAGAPVAGRTCEDDASAGMGK